MFASSSLDEVGIQVFPQLLVGLGTSCISINDNFLWQKIFFVQVQKAWVGLFLGQISAGANNDNGQNLL